MLNNNEQNNNKRNEYPFHVSEQINSKTYTIYLNQEIVEPQHYSQLIELFRNATAYDGIKVYINSPGGNLSSGIQLISAMRDSAAYIITVLDGMAMSLAPLLLLSGDEIQINEQSLLMFHDFSTENRGKGSELLSSSSAMTDFYYSILMSYAYPFLNEEEIKHITHGQDMYFDTNEIMERLDALMKYREEQQQSLEEEYSEQSTEEKESEEEPDETEESKEETDGTEE